MRNLEPPLPKKQSNAMRENLNSKSWEQTRWRNPFRFEKIYAKNAKGALKKGEKLAYTNFKQENFKKDLLSKKAGFQGFGLKNPSEYQ
ncbi:MAG: hypothetical protein CM15mP47_4960 [Methanobacteriota archaeon]|nr:MAG: hypothetical protein CM15mP47_4960 [Euryarchaeota archaeon]